MRNTTVAGVKARHAFITDACRSGRGNEGAIDEALSRIRQEYLACSENWPIGKGAEFHLVLTVKRPQDE